MMKILTNEKKFLGELGRKLDIIMTKFKLKKQEGNRYFLPVEDCEFDLMVEFFTSIMYGNRPGKKKMEKFYQIETRASVGGKVLGAYSFSGSCEFRDGAGVHDVFGAATQFELWIGMFLLCFDKKTIEKLLDERVAVGCKECGWKGYRKAKNARLTVHFELHKKDRKSVEKKNCCRCGGKVKILYIV